MELFREREASKMKKRFNFKKLTIIHVYWAIIICVLVYTVGDIAIARNTGSYVPLPLCHERVETERYQGFGTGRVDYTKLEESFLRSLEDNGANPATRDLLMFGLKFYEMSDARMRYVIENQDVIESVAEDFARSFQNDYEKGLTVKDHTEQFMEDLGSTLEKNGADGDMRKYTPEELSERITEDIVKVVEGE